MSQGLEDDRARPARTRRKQRAGGARQGHPSLRPPPAGESIRLCRTCRERQPRSALVQFKGEGASGRHSYVCIRRACLARVVDGAPALLAEAERRLLQLVGLARRAGRLALGAGALGRQEAGSTTLVLVACDAAPRTVRDIGPCGLPTPCTAEVLGAAAGHRAVAAVAFGPGRHAQQAAYWQRVWYEAREFETRFQR